MKTLLKEFKEFAVKGNVVDMAVGVIVGGAFGKIVTSLVNDIIMPLVGRADRRDRLQQSFSPARREYLRHARRSGGRGAAVLKYGSFLSQVLDFLIVSFVIFIFVKKIMTLGRKKEAPVEEAPKTKVCPYCKSEIAIDATRCPHCTSELP